MRVDAAIAEPLRRHRLCAKEAVAGRVRDLMGQAGLPEKLADRVPGQLSGGECQRVAIARALAFDPRILIADEVISALDVTLQAQVMDLLLKLQNERGLTMIFISHDLAAIRRLCKSVIVMRRGQIVERCATAAVFDNPHQGYTRQLIDAIPHLPGGAAKPTGPARERVTKAESEVPLCVERNFDNLPFETAADLANGAGVSEMTVSRFLRRLGYAHEAVKIADMCLRRNIPPILVNDRYSIWPRQYTPHMLSVATLRRILTRIRMNPAARCGRS